MGKKISFEVEEKTLALSKKNLTLDKIAAELKISRRSVCNILKKYRVPEEYVQTIRKEKTNINDLISLRLLYYCDDCELLSIMFAHNFCYQKPKKIYISKKISNIIPFEKIKKIISISDFMGLKCDIEYAI